MTFRNVFFAVVFFALTVTAANAYTVVMRDGRRIEIPNEFTVTNSTLTYEVSQGFQVSIQLNVIDIGATERANREVAGSLMKKAAAPKVVKAAPQARSRAARSITNQDLEVYRKARVENEYEYEKLRQELGLPSAEERRREIAEIEDRTLEQVRSMRAREEAYWRSRADAFRAEMAANGMQFGAYRQTSAEIPISYPYGGVSGFWPLDGFGFGVTGRRFNRFGRFQSSPFDGFLATPITPFPTFRGQARRPVFVAPGARRSRPVPIRRGSHR